MKKVSKADVSFMKLMEDPCNQQCADCECSLLPCIRQSNLLYISLNNGVFVCPSCSNFHKALGESASIIKAIRIGHLEEKEVKYFKMGGNKRFTEFMEKYDLNVLDIETKYKSRAANYYRAKVVSFLTFSFERR
eukprot:TRINITY_DN1740_c0_g1_i8.p1 TRINITY_DN1740_c0_g1~~TRINITY_DN1740_c0_g1_i8.p1  ORF type:complete len:134 (-),score=24.45 TRINITY_DN1740_c0_g1_i8:406-807(-)